VRSVKFPRQASKSLIRPKAVPLAVRNQKENSHGNPSYTYVPIKQDTQSAGARNLGKFATASYKVLGFADCPLTRV